MKTYYSSKNIFTVSLLWLVIFGIFSSFFIPENQKGESIPIGIPIFLSLIAGFLIWTVSDTKYRINNNEMKYYSGPIRGKIDILQIRKIAHVKTFFVSATLKPALDSYGLMVTYNKFDDIYISPKDKEQFLAELLKINPNIQII